ncbi:hypothetical protein HY383_01825 [Candidatus Daviesbacteria bacterium]|nr:hypothetical protein [Candidatus Daviesbacteria bacterium]
MTTEIKRGYALIEGRAKRRDFAKEYASTLRDRTHWYTVPAESGGAANSRCSTTGIIFNNQYSKMTNCIYVSDLVNYTYAKTNISTKEGKKN